MCLTVSRQKINKIMPLILLCDEIRKLKKCNEILNLTIKFNCN